MTEWRRTAGLTYVSKVQTFKFQALMIDLGSSTNHDTHGTSRAQSTQVLFFAWIDARTLHVQQAHTSFSFICKQNPTRVSSFTNIQGLKEAQANVSCLELGAGEGLSVTLLGLFEVDDVPDSIEVLDVERLLSVLNPWRQKNEIRTSTLTLRYWR